LGKERFGYGLVGLLTGQLLLTRPLAKYLAGESEKPLGAVVAAVGVYVVLVKMGAV